VKSEEYTEQRASRYEPLMWTREPNVYERVREVATRTKSTSPAKPPARQWELRVSKVLRPVMAVCLLSNIFWVVWFLPRAITQGEIYLLAVIANLIGAALNAHNYRSLGRTIRERTWVC
jgi:hypothetical protein